VSLFARALKIEDQDPRRVLGFFVLYALIFAVLGLADGLSLTMFVKRVGSEVLPIAYGSVAAGNLVFIAIHVYLAERIGRLSLRLWILGLGAIGFVVVLLGTALTPGALVYGALFGLREIAYTLLLMHFGTFLQDFFSREQLVGGMPIIYAGGRLGGLLGAGVLAAWSALLPLDGLLAVCAALMVTAALWAWSLRRRFEHVHRPSDDEADAQLKGGRGVDAQELDRRGRGSFTDFMVFAWQSPLMFWNTVTAVVYFGCRFVLNYQYNRWFDAWFATDSEMATFMGVYSVIALSFAIVLQLVVVRRMVDWLGLKGATMVYAAGLACVMGANLFGMTVVRAVLSRAMENELRFGLRNPLNQLVINKFSKALRVRVRAWSMGMLIPGATIATSFALGALADQPQSLCALGGALGGAYLVGKMRLNESYREATGRLWRLLGWRDPKS
jgi:hypothetical protein